MAYSITHIMEAYCKDYEDLFCTTNTISNTAVNSFVDNHSLFFKYYGFTWIPTLVINHDDQIKFAQIYAAADQIYMKACRSLNRSEIKRIVNYEGLV